MNTNPVSILDLIPGLHAPLDPKEWNLTLWEDHATAMISSEPAEEHTSSTYSAKDFEHLFEVDMDAFWPVATKRIEEATGKEADEEDIEEALEPIAQATAAKLVLAYQCHDELREALSWALDILDMYDERLAQIDGKERVYSPVHLAGKAKARTALTQARGQVKEETPHV